MYQKYLCLLETEISDETAFVSVEQAYQLLITLLSNICNHPAVPSYRTVKKSNKLINEQLGQYKNGVKLLEKVGFKDDDECYTNTTDVKYLKMYRTDLDIAYKNYCGHRNEK
jgi:hypothetical protein